MKNRMGKRKNLRKTRSFAAVCLLLPLLLLSFTGCRLGAPSDEEVQEILAEKLPAAKELTSIFYGEGIPLQDGSDIDESWTTPHYYRVADDFKYQTINDLKEAAQAVFSPAYLEIIYENAFEGSDEYMPRFAEDAGVLTMDVVREAWGLRKEVYPETAKVLSGSRYACKVEVECTEANGVRRSIKISLSRSEDGSWLLDSAVY